MVVANGTGRRKSTKNVGKVGTHDENTNSMSPATREKNTFSLDRAYLASLSMEDVVCIAKRHPLPSVLVLSLLFFVRVEYTLQMVPPFSPPLDVGFILTEHIHGVISERPNLNSVLAAANTVSMPFISKYTEVILPFIPFM